MNLWPIYHVLRDAREGTSRNLLAAVAVILLVSLAVTFTGATWLALGATRSLSELLREEASMRVILAESQDLKDAHSIADRIGSLDGVRSVEVVSGEATFQRMRDAFAGSVDLARVFPENPFPDSILVTLKDPLQASRVAGAVGSWPGVDEVVYGQKYLPSLLAFADAVRRLGWSLSAAFCAVALMVSIVTWQLALVSRRPEIRIKVWMGVSPAALLGQFLLEGALLGLGGGAVAAILLVSVVARAKAGLLTILPEVATAMPPPGGLAAACLLSGAALGAIGAAIAERRVHSLEVRG